MIVQLRELPEELNQLWSETYNAFRAQYCPQLDEEYDPSLTAAANAARWAWRRAWEAIEARAGRDDNGLVGIR